MRDAVVAATAALLVLAGCSALEGPGICADYGSRLSCANTPYVVASHGIYQHLGIDFRAGQGTEVISATHGTVADKGFGACEGPWIKVWTDLTGRHGDLQGHVAAIYIHVEPVDDLHVGKTVRPGDVIGRVIRARNTPCYGTVEHVHYELRVMGIYRKDIDPHEFWVDGPRRVTCFRPGMIVPPGKAVAPLRC